MFAANHAIVTFHSNLKWSEFQKPHFLLFPFTFVSCVFICAELLGPAYGFVRTAWIGLRTYQSAWYPVHHDALWQVHGVGNGQDHKSGILVSGPVKEIVHYILFLSPEKIELPGKWREMQHKPETEPGPQWRLVTTPLATCASQVTPPKLAKKSEDISLACHQRMGSGEWRRETGQLPSCPVFAPRTPNQEPRHFSIPPVGTSLPHPQAAQWFPERTLGCKIALPAVLLHG